jgi:hypothetical protein
MLLVLQGFGSPYKFKQYQIWKPLHQRSHLHNFGALSCAIPEKLDGSFLMNWLFVRLNRRLNIVQFQKERCSRIQETEFFLLRAVEEYGK